MVTESVADLKYLPACGMSATYVQMGGQRDMSASCWPRTLAIKGTPRCRRTAGREKGGKEALGRARMLHLVEHRSANVSLTRRAPAETEEQHPSMPLGKWIPI